MLILMLILLPFRQVVARPAAPEIEFLTAAPSLLPSVTLVQNLQFKYVVSEIEVINVTDVTHHPPEATVQIPSIDRSKVG